MCIKNFEHKKIRDQLKGTEIGHGEGSRGKSDVKRIECLQKIFLN